MAVEKRLRLLRLVLAAAVAAAAAVGCATAQQQDVRLVHVLFMNHLDVGFSGVMTETKNCSCDTRKEQKKK